MSKIKALITALVLGTSSVAMAGPSVSFSAEASWGASGGVSVRDHRTEPQVREPQIREPRFHRGTWISLAEPMSLARGRDVLVLENNRAKLSQLRLQSTSGGMYISFITVRFTDGKRQQIAVNRWLDARNPMLQLSLAQSGRVDRIIVYGSGSRRGGSYQVFGLSERPFRPQLYQTPVTIYEPPLAPIATPPVYQPPAPRGVMLADTLNFMGTIGYKIFAVGEDKGRFSTLQLKGVSGSVFIKKIEVHFTNGYGQAMNGIERTLRAGELLSLPLDGAGGGTIREIVIQTNDDFKKVDVMTGEFSVLAY